ncbi:MAG: zinc ABC transporter substrate-binding protein [Protaetiibacter sp.]
MTPRPRLILSVSLLAATVPVLAGCASGATSEQDSGDDLIHIVASTNVYGDIAGTIAGDTAEVTSIIDDSAQDPHEYEATSRDALALDDADLVIVNGGGYDDFMTKLLEAHDGDAVVLDAVELSGLETDGDEEFNEHVWYDFAAMATLADAIATELGELDPADAATFTANAAAFAEGLDDLTATATDIASAHGGESFAITEPVPLYLLELAGLQNATPSEFSEAVEEGTDAPALVLQEVVTLVSDGTVAFLAYNEQTVGPQTQEVLSAANAAGTPVVSFTEILPDGEDYQSWMAANLAAVDAALAA